jgi:GWxTD domain-containing protein
MLLAVQVFWWLAAAELRAASRQELEVWAEGPVRWLLLPDERKELKAAGKDDDASAFIELFWQRRDRDRDDGTNDYRDEFVKRVEAADVLYSDEGVRGSLTDRGRALILMGPPSHVTVTQEPVMAWDPARNTDDRVTMRDVDVEIWGYRMEDLPPGMLDIWMARKKRAAEDTLTLTVTFRNVGRRTSLVEGEALLEAAIEAAVLRPED